ncbi:hypothetical protein ACRALDRAFT_1072395 [Sodiomyces alcalophilus JCM 7366]|uniref:uncharacterized protein n=1 Tax=Sodiomyces alcalophilus JCM 7366 TaxID=591952 RepID=UPI0039B64157
MTRTTSLRTYGKTTRTRPRRQLAELPQSPVRRHPATYDSGENGYDDSEESTLNKVTDRFKAVTIEDGSPAGKEHPARAASPQAPPTPSPSPPATVVSRKQKNDRRTSSVSESSERLVDEEPQASADEPKPPEAHLRVLTWHDVCPPGDTIIKIAEASYAEVYRVNNERGTSIIKVIRLVSPIKPQTKAQVRSGLVDEEPHPPDDLEGELRISEWLAHVPGFVVYKERYIVQGRAPKPLTETHQAFHRRVKRQDPDRLQFYPSPSRYLDDTRFLVVELGDAGVALEDFELGDTAQLWDIFLLVAIALARGEELHRDLHEGNLCIRRVSEPRRRDTSIPGPAFGYSGLDITILDYGLSRAETPLPCEDDDADEGEPPENIIVALDLEKDLGIFTSTHAQQCKVYRQMRSFLIHSGTSRKCLPPSAHNTPYPTVLPADNDHDDDDDDNATQQPTTLSWAVSAPYTNVLWLAYTYQYLVGHFRGPKRDVTAWRRETAQLWKHLNPDAKPGTPVFGCAADVVRFAVEAGWLTESQVMGGSADGSYLVEREDSIILSREEVAQEEVGAATAEEGEGDAAEKRRVLRSLRSRKGTESR